MFPSRPCSETSADSCIVSYYDWGLHQESIRFHPAVYHNYRFAVRDDVLPLSKSIITTTGEVISKLPIPKGLKVILSISGYQRSVGCLY